MASENENQPATLNDLIKALDTVGIIWKELNSSQTRLPPSKDAEQKGDNQCVTQDEMQLSKEVMELGNKLFIDDMDIFKEKIIKSKFVKT